jgi:hypothetical protein
MEVVGVRVGGRGGARSVPRRRGHGAAGVGSSPTAAETTSARTGRLISQIARSQSTRYDTVGTCTVQKYYLSFYVTVTYFERCKIDV